MGVLGGFLEGYHIYMECSKNPPKLILKLCIFGVL